jgi:hypothetical protein
VKLQTKQQNAAGNIFEPELRYGKYYLTGKYSGMLHVSPKAVRL